ncbi:MAG: DUF2779 domain-containing protein [Leptospiraceae bacterium]|nr:DUF2779 domain-containing protein [Leptospiraceae bacterium]
MNTIQNSTIFKYARTLYPKGIDYNSISDKENFKFSQPVYNASFHFEDLNTDIDLIIPREGNTLEIIEFKPTVNHKLENFFEMGFHIYILQKLGFTVEKANLVLINPKYKFKGEINPEEYFNIKDVLSRAVGLQGEIENKILELREVLSKENLPERISNRSCLKPNDCKYTNLCWNDLGESDIFKLREGGKLSNSLFNDGIRFLKDIPPEIELSNSQKIQITCELENNVFINYESITNFLKDIKKPYYFIDFETVNPAFPLYNDSLPYQHIPFLFYLFIQREDEELKEVYYIEQEGDDPRKRVLEILKDIIKSEGTIFCYNDLIEKKCIRESAEIYTEYKDWSDSIMPLFKDLSIPFKNFYYYNPLQNGSATLKSILPALTGVDYSDLNIKDGNTANSEFLNWKFRPEIVKDKENLFKELIEYCRMDSLALVKILEKLELFKKEDDFLIEGNSV